MRYAHEFEDGWILVDAETGEHGVVLFKSKEEAEKDLNLKVVWDVGPEAKVK